MSAALSPEPWVLSPEVHAISIPARTFTGDFWYTRRTADRLWFALGDVAGKGLPAALVMAMIQEELEQRVNSCARAGCDPSVTMKRLHDFLMPLLPRNRFATAAIGWLHDDGTLRIVNGGHCPPLVLRADGRVEAIGSTGPVVGVLERSRWESATLTLDEGDKLLLYSDGVVEAASSDGEEFGQGGIERVLARAPASARGTASALVDAVREHSANAREDDLTVLVIGVR